MSRVMNWFRKFQRFADRWWFGPFLGLLAAADAYVFVISVEALLLPAVLVERKRWVGITFWVTFGSAFGAATFAFLAGHYGEAVIQKSMPGALHSEAWMKTDTFIKEHGFGGLAFVSLSPFPQHFAVAVAGLARMNAFLVFGAVFLGRALKYFFLSWAAVYSPQLLRRLRILPHGHHHKNK